MCVKIVNSQHDEVPYDTSRPLEDQIQDAEQIVVNYQPSDSSVGKFLQEIERVIKTGVETKLSIKVIHNDNIFGFKLKKKMNQMTNDIRLNEIIKLMVLTHSNIDRKLEDLAKQCNGMCNEQQKA